jgi:hypothetical protein
MVERLSPSPSLRVCRSFSSLSTSPDTGTAPTLVLSSSLDIEELMPRALCRTIDVVSTRFRHFLSCEAESQWSSLLRSQITGILGSMWYLLLVLCAVLQKNVVMDEDGVSIIVSDGSSIIQ